MPINFFYYWFSNRLVEVNGVIVGLVYANDSHVSLVYEIKIRSEKFIH